MQNCIASFLEGIRAGEGGRTELWWLGESTKAGTVEEAGSCVSSRGEGSRGEERKLRRPAQGRTELQQPGKAGAVEEVETGAAEEAGPRLSSRGRGVEERGGKLRQSARGGRVELRRPGEVGVVEEVEAGAHVVPSVPRRTLEEDGVTLSCALCRAVISSCTHRFSTASELPWPPRRRAPPPRWRRKRRAGVVLGGDGREGATPTRDEGKGPVLEMEGPGQRRWETERKGATPAADGEEGRGGGGRTGGE